MYSSLCIHNSASLVSTNYGLYSSVVSQLKKLQVELCSSNPRGLGVICSFVLSKFIHVVAYISASFLFITEYYFIPRYLPIYQLMDTCVLYTFWLLWLPDVQMLCIFVCNFCVNMFSFLLGIYRGVELLGHMITVCLLFPHFFHKPFSKTATPFCISTSNVWGLQHSSANVIIHLSDESNLREFEVVAHCDFGLHCPDG